MVFFGELFVNRTEYKKIVFVYSLTCAGLEEIESIISEDSRFDILGKISEILVGQMVRRLTTVIIEFNIIPLTNNPIYPSPTLK